MGDNQENPGYLLLIRTSDEWEKGLSAGELETEMRKFVDWVNGMRERGILNGANPLEAAGKVVSGSGGNIVTDGPFAESKEAIGGYFYLNVATLDEAVAQAQACPALNHGCTMEVRPIAAMCPLIEQAGLADAINYKN